MTVREAEFSDIDRLALLASKWADGRPRGEHGILLEDAMSPENQFAYEATKPVEDYAQSAVNKAVAAYEKSRPSDDTRSVRFGVKKRTA